MKSIRPRKGLSQHFLRRDIDARAIVAGLDLSGDDTVLEIGPGKGVLSHHLVRVAREVIAVEIDDRLIPYLETFFARHANFHLIHDDILQCDLSKIRQEHGGNSLKIIGNLPYAVTTPILFFLLDQKSEIDHIVVTLQKEVGRRILASPGGKEYGALTIAIQYHCLPEHILDLPPEAFYPVPKVDSTVLRLRILPQPSITVRNEALYFRVVRAAFGQRRKMLRNALAAALPLTSEQMAAIAEKSGIDMKRRGETLSLSEFGRLSDVIDGEHYFQE